MCAVLCLQAIICNLSIKVHQEVIKHQWLCCCIRNSVLSKNDAVQYDKQGAQGISKSCIKSLLDNLDNFTKERSNFADFSLTNYNWEGSDRNRGIRGLGIEFLFEDMQARMHQYTFQSNTHQITQEIKIKRV
jgi:hypothetical protein